MPRGSGATWRRFRPTPARFMGGLERPDVDKIEGLSPVISIEQKTTSRNPRSTVGTITEIYDFLRLLYARTAEAFSYATGKKMIRQSDDQIINYILQALRRQEAGGAGARGEGPQGPLPRRFPEDCQAGLHQSARRWRNPRHHAQDAGGPLQDPRHRNRD